MCFKIDFIYNFDVFRNSSLFNIIQWFMYFNYLLVIIIIITNIIIISIFYNNIAVCIFIILFSLFESILYFQYKRSFIFGPIAFIFLLIFAYLLKCKGYYINNPTHYFKQSDIIIPIDHNLFEEVGYTFICSKCCSYKKGKKCRNALCNVCYECILKTSNNECPDMNIHY